MKKRLMFIVIGVVASIAGYLLYKNATPVIQQVDLRLKDVRFRLRGAVKTSAPVTIVAIDGRSVKEIGRWPWSREVTARLISAMKSYGARVVALDIVFSEPQGRRQDQALAAAIRRSGQTIEGYYFTNELQNSDPEGVEQLSASRIKVLRVDEGVTSVKITEFTAVDTNIPVIGAAASGFGFFNQTPDPDGLYRKAPLLLLFDGILYPSLSLEALGRYYDREIMVNIAPFGVRDVAIDRMRIPVNENGALPLNYYGPAGTFDTFSAADVLLKRIPPSSLKGRLVFVGATETGIADVRATPFDPLLPGVEIHATVAANAFDGRFLTRDSRTFAFEIVFILLVPVLFALLLAAVPNTLSGLALFTATGGGYCFINYLLFSRFNYDTSIIFPLVPLVLTYAGSEAYRNLVTEKKGRYLKRAFSSYVSADLVNEIIKDPDRLKLGGEKREVTLLFSDIRGFTTLSEALPPEDLVKLLNRYLSPMTSIVLEQRGTLDKYIGDAVMAIYNAPLYVEGHAVRACRSAVFMMRKLKELNEEFARQGMPQIDIGIGIHTGEAVVGNMGADIRFDYTAIGDNVNLASRLEGLNKYYGTHILVSGITRNMAGKEFNFREIDLVRVKGKEQPVALFELRVDDYPEVAAFESALKLYRLGHFADAASAFSSLAGDFNDPVAVMYVDRCREYENSPPLAGWDGVYVARGK